MAEDGYLSMPGEGSSRHCFSPDRDCRSLSLPMIDQPYLSARRSREYSTPAHPDPGRGPLQSETAFFRTSMMQDRRHICGRRSPAREHPTPVSSEPQSGLRMPTGATRGITYTYARTLDAPIGREPGETRHSHRGRLCLPFL